MNKNRKTDYIQPAEHIREHELNWLTSPEVKAEVIRKIPYLHAVQELFEGSNSPDPLLDRQRILLLADEAEFAEKAAMAFLNLRKHAIALAAGAGKSRALSGEGYAESEKAHSQDPAAHSQEEEAWQMSPEMEQILQKARAVFHDDDVYFEDGPDEEEQRTDAYVIVDGEHYPQDHDGSLTGFRPFDLQRVERVLVSRLSCSTLLETGQNAYVDGFKTPVCDELIDDMRGWKSDIVMIGMPNTPGGKRARRRLVFEQDFTVLRIPAPTTEWYEFLMARSMEAEGLGVRPPEETAQITARLKRHRGSLFREDDIFRFSQLAADRQEQKREKEDEH